MPWVTPPIRFSLLLLLCALPARSADVATAWRHIGSHLTTDAAASLQAAKAAGREWTLADAVARIERPPVTEEKLTRVEADLTALAQGDDEVAAAADYLIARLYQYHRLQPDLARAAAHYRSLAERRPASPWAQLGLVKLAMLMLYLPPEPAPPEVRLAAAEALLPRVTDPALRRDLHLVIGRAAHFHRRPLPEVLPHLVAAEGGIAGDELWRTELQIQIGELALRAGELGTAQRYFERVVAHNDVDPRVFLIREKLAEIARRRATEPEAVP